MPSGKVHDNIAALSIFPVFITGFFLFKHNYSAIILFTSAAFISQFMFGPDLDARSSQYERWGMFKYLWIPYRKIFKHRSRYSHGLILGPIIRCIYLFIMILLILIFINYCLYSFIKIDLYKITGIAQFMLHNIDINYTALLYYSTIILSGLFTGAAIHTLTDKIASFFKNLI